MVLAMMDECFAIPTPAGTILTSGIITINIAQTYITTANPLVSITVQPIYGVSAVPTVNQVYVVTQNQTSPVYFARHIENHATTADILNVSVNASTDWKVDYVLDTNGNGVLDTGETTTIAAQITLDALTSADIFVRLTPIVLNPVTAQISVQTIHPASAYTGFNGQTYGGLMLVTGNDIVKVSAAAISFSLKSLLQGFYNSQNDMQITTSVSVELRPTRNQTAATAYTVTLKANGWSDPIQLLDVLPGSYYVFIKHYNHVSVVTTTTIAFANNVVTTLNISDTNSPYFVPIYLSATNNTNVTQNLRTERNGKLTIRGGQYNGLCGNGITYPNDNKINISDYRAFSYAQSKFPSMFDPEADFNGDGIIDNTDYGIWLSNMNDYVPID
jgi:5-hydroxyisourate hydrolase-like protein (transthyretin family)